jgi:putative SOS response-associated peptidase YedK
VCGRFALDQTTNDLMAEFAATTNRFPDWEPRWNIAPTTTIPIVIDNSNGERVVGPARWSLTPSWSKELVLAYPTFNARSETAAEKPTFRQSVSRHRCIIPVSGYYEWASLAGSKIPHYIYLATGEVAGLAGLYSWWTNRDSGEVIATTTILTRESAGELARIHDRMPVVVRKEDRDRWLDSSSHDGAELLATISQSTAEGASSWQFYPVSPLKGDGPHLVERKDVHEGH